MASTVTNLINTIDTGFPVAGQNNDSQGFRSNFSIIQSALLNTEAEIESLQSLLGTKGDVYNSSLTTPGYQQLPGGLIMQWGQSAPITGQTTGTVTFATPFSTAVLSVTATPINATYSTTTTITSQAVSASLTGATFMAIGSGSAAFSYIALGY
jgi:hypothetical protein